MITSSSRWCAIRREISTVQVIWITCHSTACKRSKRLVKSWCTQQWALDSKSTRCPNLRLGPCIHRMRMVTTASSILRPRSILSRWIKFKRRGLSRLHRLGWQTWCLISSRATLISMRWQIVHWQQKVCPNKPKQIIEELKVNHQLSESTECKLFYTISYF